jgi:hypothetical protein
MQLPAFKTFCGERVTNAQLEEIKELVALFPSLSRTELANTICELFSWKRPTGKLKTVEAIQYLEVLEDWKIIRLPDTRGTRQKGLGEKVVTTEQSDRQEEIEADLKDISPITLERITTKEQRQLFYEYVERYHYLGYQRPFGAQIRYFIRAEGIDNAIIGCLQWSSPAWRMTPRDRFIDWTEEERVRNLQKIVNNSRFLIFPWVKVKNLASRVLSISAKSIAQDWKKAYKYEPVLLETLVDPAFDFSGTCYKAANWVHVGTTTGRGRMDKQNQRHGAAPNEIFLYPLTPNFRDELTC